MTVNTPAKLLAAGVTEMDVTVSDISELGVAIIAHTPLFDAVDCIVAMTLPRKEKLPRVNFWGRVVYSYPVKKGYRIGIRFMDMDTRSRDCIQCLSLKLMRCEQACGHNKDG